MLYASIVLTGFLTWWLWAFLVDRQTTKDREAYFRKRQVAQAKYLWQLRKAKRFKKRGNAVVFIVR